MARMQFDLIGLWRLQPDTSNKGLLFGYEKPDCDDSAWLPAYVPCAAEQCGQDMQHAYLTSVWYRRRFDVPASWAGKRVVIRFEGVFDHCDVYLNGTKIGSHPDGYLRFELPTGKALRVGQPNVLALRVDAERQRADLPGFERGWRTYCGILREVYAIATDPLHIADAYVRAEPTGDGGQLTAYAQVANERGKSTSVILTASVRDADGKRIASWTSKPIKLAAGEQQDIELGGQVADVQAWSPDAPALYHVDLELSSDGTPADATSVRFGFRKIEARGTQILLNGKPIFLTGFNRHEDSPRTRMEPDMECVRQDIVAMKQTGANFVRLCHYPHHPGEMDLCDEIGMLVMCEIPLYWWRGYEFGEDIFKAKRANAKRQLASMIRRDRNHPSVIFWSVSNETHEHRPEVAEGNALLIRLAQEMDPTRFATHVCSVWYKDFNFEPDDVICLNSYPSNHLDRWQNLPSDDNVMNTQPRLAKPDLTTSQQFWKEKLAALHERFPNKPIVITEYGHEGLKGVTGGHYGEDTQAAIIEAESAALTAPYVRGMTIWCWADHLWHESDRHDLSVSPYGVLTRDRKPKLSHAVVKKIFTERQRQA